MWLRNVRTEMTGIGLAVAVLGTATVFDFVADTDALAMAVLLMLAAAGLVAARLQAMTPGAERVAVAQPLRLHGAASPTDPDAAFEALLTRPAIRTGSLGEAARALLEGAAHAIPLDHIALYLATGDREQVRRIGALDTRTAVYAEARTVARTELAPFDIVLAAHGTGAADGSDREGDTAPSHDPSASTGDSGNLVVPVVVSGRTKGVLWLSRTEGGQAWSQTERLLAAAVSGLAADVIQRTEGTAAEAAALKSRQALSRQNEVMNGLLRPGPVRDGDLSDAMRELSRTLATEAGIDRVAITVLGTSRDDVVYAEVFVAADGAHHQVFTTASVRPTTMVHAARPEFIIVADDVRNSKALAPFYDGLLKVLDIRSFMQMPIEVGGRVVGIVNASICGRSITWSIEQRLFLIATAQLAALVIERDARRRAEARVAAQAEMLTRQLEAVTNLMRDDVVVRGGLDDALDRITRSLGIEIGAQCVALTLYEHETRKVAYRRRYDAPTDRHTDVFDDAIELPPETTVDASPQALEAAVDAAASHVQTDGQLHTPVIVGGRVAGSLTARSPRANTPWRPDQKLMALALAQLAALTFERVQLSRMERELRRASAVADAASKAKSRFLASMSHEIRTPMNGVMGMTDHLLRTALDDRQLRMATTIRDCAGTLLSLINDILDLSRIEAGRIEIERRPTQSRTVCESVVDLFAADVARKGLDLTLVVHAAVPDAVMIDDHRLRQVLINVVGNAVKFTQTGEVAVTMSTSEDRTRVRFAVTDTGIGVAPERLPALFEPFTQADSSISRRFGGTGLGLAISRRLVGLMGGTIGMTSKPGRGTEVTIDLPLVPAEAPPAAALLSERRVLLVAAPGTGRDRARLELEHAGAKVTIAEAGTETSLAAAVATCAGAADAVVVDVGRGSLMQEVLQTLARSKSVCVPVVALLPAGMAKAPVAIKGLATLVAPYQHQDLVAAVARGSGEPAPRTAPARARPRFAKRILVVEDNAVNELVLSEHLLAFGCGVQIVRDGEAAVAAVQKGRFDLILMDRQLPGMDGLSATTAIRAIETRRRRKRTPIVLVTASAFPEDVEAARSAGCDDHLAKPFSEEGLTAMLERMLGTTAPARSAPEAVPTPRAGAGPKRASRSATPRAAKAKPQAAPQRSAGMDETALRRLETTNARLFERLLRTYVEYTPSVIAALRTAADAGDAAGLRLAAHSLKSSSANVCATTLADLARAAEAAAGSGKVDDAPRSAAEIEAEFAAVVDRLTTELGRFTRPAA